jgi:hypothetical protein
MMHQGMVEGGQPAREVEAQAQMVEMVGQVVLQALMQVREVDLEEIVQLQ